MRLWMWRWAGVRVRVGMVLSDRVHEMGCSGGLRGGEEASENLQMFGNIGRWGDL
jgi:hypothetical protein